MFFYKFDGDMFEKKNRENYQVICVVYSIKSLHCTSRLRSSVAVLGQLSRSTVNLQEKLQHVILWFHCAVPASISVFKACSCSGSMAPKNPRKQLSATPNVPCLYMCGCACLCYKFFFCVKIQLAKVEEINAFDRHVLESCSSLPADLRAKVESRLWLGSHLST